MTYAERLHAWTARADQALANPNAIDSPRSLLQWLELIELGVQLRRHWETEVLRQPIPASAFPSVSDLEAMAPTTTDEVVRHGKTNAAEPSGVSDSLTSSVVEQRRVVMALLFRCQDTFLHQLQDSMQAGAVKEIRHLEELVERLVHRDQHYFSHILADADLSLMTQVALLDNFQADLQFLQAVSSNLTGEQPPEPALMLRVNLERLTQTLQPTGELENGRDAPYAQALQQCCQSLRLQMYSRRVQDELANALKSNDPNKLWARRLMLSRLQTEVSHLLVQDFSARGIPPAITEVSPTRPPEEVGKLPEIVVTEAEPTIDQDTSDTTAAPPHSEILQNWVHRLAERRAHLAQQLQWQLEQLSPTDRLERLQQLAQMMREDYSETLGVLEDLPLAQAVSTLTLMNEDLCELMRLGQDLARLPDQKAETTANLQPTLNQVARTERSCRWELLEKRLYFRLVSQFGRRFVRWLDNLNFFLILFIVVLIGAESFTKQYNEWREVDPVILEEHDGMTPGQEAFFAIADLIVCLFFLGDFALRMAYVNNRWLYFKVRWWVDLLPAIPFSFLVWSLHSSSYLASIVPLLRTPRLIRLIRFLRLARPIIRGFRLFLFASRFADRLVRRYAGVFNQNILLFEPHKEEEPEAKAHHQLRKLREQFLRRYAEMSSQLTLIDRAQLCPLTTPTFRARLSTLPSAAVAQPENSLIGQREIPAEAVVQQLIEMTPEQLVERLGQPFVDSVDRYLKMFDVIGVRNLPVLNHVLQYRHKGPAEAVSLAVNYLGYLIQRLINTAYYVADLQGTITPPIFIDRLGQMIVNSTSRPAMKLIQLIIIMVVFYLLLRIIPLLDVVGVYVVEPLIKKFGTPVLIVGVVCFVFWMLGLWLKRIANQAASENERLVEAQFATQTKDLKQRSQAQDVQFLVERVVQPEFDLRSCDDITDEGELSSDRPIASKDLILRQVEIAHISNSKELNAEEFVFLQNIRLLYRDYLDGPLFHRNDVKTTVQLLGNVALSNLRKSHLTYAKSLAPQLRQLELSRADTLFGGPYMWINYVNRLITQETAKLLLDFNRNAIPKQRLASASLETREAYRQWLASRLGIAPEAVQLPEPIGSFGNLPSPSATAKKRAGVDGTLESVDFMAVDFLCADPERRRNIEIKYGSQVAQLIDLTRKRNIRRAFRSYPLHNVPPQLRTLNPFELYETYFSNGKVLIFPFRVIGWIFWLAWRAGKSIIRLIIDILNPQISLEEPPGTDSFEIALRKVHRMRKPVYMQSLWLRAHFDVGYLGLSLPDLPINSTSESLLDEDLDYIGSSRYDYLAAEALRKEQEHRLRWITRWLREQNLNFQQLSEKLSDAYPFLTERSAEVTRALVMAFISDHTDIYTLASSLSAMKIILKYLADPHHDLSALPQNLPDPVQSNRQHWYEFHKHRRPWKELFQLPEFAHLDANQQRQTLRYLKRHRSLCRGWVNVLLGQGGAHPTETLQQRLWAVVQRTDLWSDQLIVLRTIQTLTVLDVHHYCEMVWELGGYREIIPQDVHYLNPLPLRVELNHPDTNEAQLVATTL